MWELLFFLEVTRAVLGRGMICSDLHFKDDSGNHETWLGLGWAEHSCLRAIAVISVRGDEAKSLWCWSLVSLDDLLPPGNSHQVLFPKSRTCISLSLRCMK